MEQATVGRVVATAEEQVAVGVWDREVWIVRSYEGSHHLRRCELDGAEQGTETSLGGLGADVRISVARVGGQRVALVEGERGVYVREDGDELVVEDLGPRGRERRVLVGGRGVVEHRGNALVFRSGTLSLPSELASSTVIGGALALDGAGVLLELEQGGRRSAVLLDPRRGAVKMRIRLGEARVLASAERRGVVVLGRGAHVALFDLRAGRCVGERILPASAVACAVDADGTRLVVLDEHGTAHELAASLSDWSAGEPEPAPEPEPEPAPEVPSAPEPPPPVVEAPALPEPSLPSLLGVFGPSPSPTFAGGELDAYLADARALVEAIASTALAARDADALAPARLVEREAAVRFAQWNRPGSPHVEVARELGLSPLASMLLLLAAAPQVWGEIARVYARCTDDSGRPLVDELLLGQLLNAGTSMRTAIARELDDDSPLVASGAVSRGTGLRPYVSIQAHAAIARRLAGGGSDATPSAAVPLERFLGPRAAIAALAQGLVEHAGAPVRVLITGRPNSGRLTLATSLGARAGRRLGLVSVQAAGDVRRDLLDVALRGQVPCVSLDELPEDPAVRARVRAALDSHRGPLLVRAPLGGEPPLAPGYHAIELPPLTESERREAWRVLLAEHGREDACAEDLAARFDVGPGAMVRAASDKRRPIAASLRQYRSMRIASVATRVDRLPSWDQLVVPSEVSGALHEVCARVQHRAMVMQAWGMDAVASTAQGVVALFQGGPGTGKTMAAGVIAHALGFELWRVDLAKVVSKWIGETEKNLAAVFDAAEQGEMVLLFDEADSLFAKRTEVKSSQERNANLETNYLLQRLDSFRGVAILTTNFGTSIDPAFKRRVSVHVEFAFPDETERERLWRAHLPPALPRDQAIDFAALARRYPLSGGYIRNAAIRAAYLAAAASERVGEHHLHQAVALEYQRTGKLGEGRLE